MQNTKHFAPVATMISIILAILLTGCGVAPQYGAVSTLTAAPTIVATALPSAEDAAVKFQSAFYTRNYTEKFEVYQARVCALATDAGCKALGSTLKNIKDNDPKYKVQTGVKITNPIMLGSGVLPSGKIWQAWQVDAKYTKPWAGLRSNDLHPASFFSWENGVWKYDGQASKEYVETLLKPNALPTKASTE